MRSRKGKIEYITLNLAGERKKKKNGEWLNQCQQSGIKRRATRLSEQSQRKGCTCNSMFAEEENWQIAEAGEVQEFKDQQKGKMYTDFVEKEQKNMVLRGKVLAFFP